MSWEILRRFAGEKLTVAAILGGGVQGVVEVEGSSSFFGFGAKKREITCCFGFPIMPTPTVVVVVVVVVVVPSLILTVRSAKAVSRAMWISLETHFEV